MALPGEFSELEPFVPLWAFATENLRSEKRWNSSPEDFQAFYDAVIGRLDDALAFLNRYEIGAMPPDARTLYHLVLAFAEASPHVEMYRGSAQVPNSFDAHRFVAAHGAFED